MDSRKRSDGDLIRPRRSYSHSPSSRRSVDFINPMSRLGLGATEMASEMFPINLELKVEPMNPCAGCVSDREVAAKIWAYVNLALALTHTSYKFWVTIMLAGGAHQVLRVYAYIYVLFCSRTEFSVTGRGYSFDIVSQVLYLLGSICFVASVADVKELKAHRRLLVQVYIFSILTHIVGSTVPQTLFWIFDGHCIPPEGMSVCQKNNTKGRLEISKGSYLEGTKTRQCFPLTHTYFVILYFSTLVFMGVWWAYGFVVAQSFLHTIKKPLKKDEERPKPPPQGKQGPSIVITPPPKSEIREIKFADDGKKLKPR